MRKIGLATLLALVLVLALLFHSRQHEARERDERSSARGARDHRIVVNYDLANAAGRKPSKVSQRPAVSEKTDGLGPGERFGTLGFSVDTFVDGKKVPTAQAVPGKPGFIFSPYDNKIIDATGAEPGSLFEDGSPEGEPRFIKLPGGLPPEMDSIDPVRPPQE